MTEDRRILWEWLQKNISDDNTSHLEELRRILDLAPPLLTYSLKRFQEESRSILSNNPYAPIYVDLGTCLVSVIGFRYTELDGAGAGPDEAGVVAHRGSGETADVEGADQVDLDDLAVQVEVVGRAVLAVLAEGAGRPANTGAVHDAPQRGHGLRGFD